MRAAALTLALSLAALPLQAQEPAMPAPIPGERQLSAAEFEARTTGRTMNYTAAGTAYGVEQYLTGRRVVWAFTGDDCQKGEWYESGGYICFAYENLPSPQCWTFYDSDRGLIARFRGDPIATPLVGIQQNPAPLACLGPDVGV